MGVKSTVLLTREAAEAKWVEKKLEEIRRIQSGGLESFVKNFSDVELENVLEEMNDAEYRRDGYGHGYDNFSIVPQDVYDDWVAGRF